ncbi:LamG-like jellyroll fold domain-containing protein [Proteinivorax tanatarense]|uniref:LamG-like jellyroll fold domain-containing protein n=1 Tax=Proteinivorax tanatarense TaxID=1260629 RepID=A0AAU7VKC3_9FIRM
MSRKWEKSDGKFVVIKFDKALTNEFKDKTLNNDAFTITGSEHKHVNGPLIDKDYPLKKVDAVPLWSKENVSLEENPHKEEKSLFFQGNNHISIPFIEKYSSDNLRVKARIMTNTTSGNQRIVNTPNDNAWALYIFNGQPRVNIYGEQHGGPNGDYFKRYKFHDIEFSYKKGEVDIFFDGEKVYSFTTTNKVLKPTTGIEIGKRDDGNYFDGIISDVEIWTNDTKVGHWKIDEEAGDTAFDLINNNDGVIDRPTWYYNVFEPFWGSFSYYINSQGQLIVSTRDSGRCVLTNPKEFKDGEILIKVKTQSKSNSQIRAHLRTKDNSNGEQGYFVEIYGGDDIIRIACYRPSFATLASMDYPWDTDTYYWVRFQAMGDKLRAKVWPDKKEEPDSWMLEAEDDQYEKGKFGIGYFTSTGRKTFDHISFLEGDGVYKPTKEVQTKAIESEHPCMFKIEKSEPENTKVDSFISFDKTNWQPINSGEVIDDKTFYLKFILSTEKTLITPTLKSTALADNLKIVLETKDLSTERFQNVKGELTVSYDASKGNLTGEFGSVESFTENFKPEGLKPLSNPNLTENINVSTDYFLEFIKVKYKGVPAEKETITAKAINLDLDFIHIDVINP